MCVLGTEIQFIVYNDLECEKAANILYIVLSVTDFIICYEFMKHHTWGTSRRAITRHAQLYIIFLMFKLSCNVTSTWSIRVSSEFKPRSTSLSIHRLDHSFPCYIDDRMVTSLESTLGTPESRTLLSAHIYSLHLHPLHLLSRHPQHPWCSTSLPSPSLGPMSPLM